MPKTLREILMELLYRNPCGEEFDNKIVNQAISEIQGLVPEEMPIWDTTGIEGKMPIGLKLHLEGFNLAIKQVKERMGI